MRYSRSSSAVRRLAFSRGVTYAGGNAAFWALSAILYEQSHSVTLVAAAGLASFSVPAVLSPLVGMLGDHHDRRRVLVWSELAGAVCSIGLAVASGSVVALLGFRVLASVASAPYLPVTNSALPSLVLSSEELDCANATMASAGIAGCLIGGAAAGLLLTTIGASFVFLLNAITFLISAALISSVRGEFRPRPSQQGNLAAGFAFFRQHSVLRPTTIAYGIAFAGAGVTIPAEIVVAAEFDVGSIGYAALFTLWGTGSLVGAVVGKARLKKWSGVAVIGSGAMAMAVGFLTVSAAPIFAIALFAIATGGIGEGLWDVAQTSLTQRATPDGIRSRVFAGTEAVMQVGIAVGLASSGLIAALGGARGVFAVGGGLSGIAGLIAFLRGLPAEVALRDNPHPKARAQELHGVSSSDRRSVRATRLPTGINPTA